MHALLIHQVFASPNDAGGTRHYELAKIFVAQGHRFTIVASDLSYLSGQKTVAGNSLVSEEQIDGIRILRAYTYPALHRSFAWRVVSFVSFMFTSLWAARLAKQVDVVIGTSPPIFQAVSAWLVAAVSRRPFLLEIRDLWPDFAIGLGVLTNPMLISTSRWLERFLYARATHLLVNSPAYVDYLVKCGVPSDKISLIANGTDPNMFRPEWRAEELRATLGLSDSFVVTYAGAMGLANDLPTVLQAAGLLSGDKRIHFVIVGDGKERSNLEALSSKLNLVNISFMGPRPKSDMVGILAASDVCLAILKNIPMFRTTYPNKVFDYMAAGRPTILAIDGVIREVIDAAGGGVFVPPGDARALAATVQSLSHDPDGVKRMGEDARAFVIAHFNRHHQAKQFSVLLQRLAAYRSVNVSAVG